MEVGCPRLKCQRNSFRLIQTFFINAFLSFLLHSKPPFNKSSKKITPPAAVSSLDFRLSRDKTFKRAKKRILLLLLLLHIVTQKTNNGGIETLNSLQSLQSECCMLWIQCSAQTIPPPPLLFFEWTITQSTCWDSMLRG
jgi:hypothetical protein